MLLSTNPDIKETIIALLAKGAVDSTELQKMVEEKKKVTKQGFYKALRELLAEEVVVKNKQLVVLSNLWVNKLQSFVTQVDEQYKQSSDFIALQEGEYYVSLQNIGKSRSILDAPVFPYRKTFS